MGKLVGFYPLGMMVGLPAGGCKDIYKLYFFALSLTELIRIDSIV